VGDGWLIFDMPQADMGCHPSERVFHEISFYCDDIDATVDQLKVRGVEFSSEIQEREWGRAIHFRMPGEIEVELYQPKYTKGAPRSLE
jgi:predicted enzyme related to lactoylglutathione lyase